MSGRTINPVSSLTSLTIASAGTSPIPSLPPAHPNVMGVRLISSLGPMVAIRSLDSVRMRSSISSLERFREEEIFATYPPNHNSRLS